MLCPGPFHFSHFGDNVYNCCPLPDPDVVLWRQVVAVWHAGRALQNVCPDNYIVDFMVIVPICL